jgi:hypothetical protein
MSNTVTAVQNNGTYEGSYGTMYKQEVTLDDGSTGEVSAKTADKWKVGDVVEVQRTETQYGTRFKFSIPQTGGKPGGNFQKDPETQLRIEASWAIGQAIAAGERSHDKLVAIGLRFIDARNALIQALKDAQKDTKQ